MLIGHDTTSSDSRSGHVARREGGDLFITNLDNGMDIYSFPPTTSPSRNVRFHISRNFILKVAVATTGDFVVVGGEDGHARIYNTHVGVMDGMLPHGNRMSLQL